MKVFKLLLLSLIIPVSIYSCTSSEVESESATEESPASLSGDSSLESASDSGALGDEFTASEDGEFAESTDLGDAISEDGFSDDGFSDSLDSTTTSEADSTPTEGDAMTEESEYSPTPEPVTSAGTDEPYYEEPIAPEATSAVGESEDTQPKPMVGVKKVATTPYKKSGILVNTVYLVRPNETLEDISQKIYQQNKTDELLKINTTLGKGVKVGDKVYYNSPKRPDDDTKLITYYEDNGISPMQYTTVEGDNIRKISKNLLGDSGSWKEVWATNQEVESKGDLQAGTVLTYWPKEVTGGSVATESVASSDGATDQAEQPPANMGEDNSSDGAQNDFAANDEIPSPPPVPDFNESSGGLDSADDLANAPPPPPSQPEQLDYQAPPPPPTVGSIDPPPPPPPSDFNKAGSTEDAESDGMSAFGEDPNQMTALGVGAILLLASVAIFIIIRKKKRRQSLDFNTATQTQIE